MAANTWTLMDAYADDGRQVFNWDQLNAAIGPFSVKQTSLRGGRRDGVELMEIGNGKLRFALVPQRGLGLWRCWQGSVEIGWKSPVKGPIHPNFVPVFDPGGLGWLEGFDEFMCRCGLESNGAPEFDEQGKLLYPLHGRVANLPAYKLAVEFDEDQQELTLSGEVDETRFHFQKLRLTASYRIKSGEKRLRIVDTVTNLSASPAEIQMLYHTNFGSPMLDPGSRVVAPVRELVPRNARAAEGISDWESYGNDESGFEEQVYFLRLAADAEHRTRILLRNAHGNYGVSLAFNTDQLPCFTVWKNTTALPDGYVTGLEPGTNFPNPRSFEQSQGRTVSIPGGEAVTFDWEIEFHDTPEAVQEAEQKVARLQTGVEPKVHAQPQPGWSADA